ncbi:aminotransferase class IV [Argonema galeatum]|uniref:aminotransferase class IV n=1 Tax=Argonema galeatum TaxID=2942762 RepID=UPI00201185A3|nr:aminotransferase class IV [Argonema galeatum]MCL1468124.1 aminotransferase class IV [Argonema galeatum A003/A1]
MIFEAAPIAWHNGKLVEREQAAPSIASHSLHLGVGVFDGLMAYWNSDRYYIHRLDAHLDRLRNGSTQMGLVFSWSNEDLKAGILSLLDEIPANNYYIRPIVYRSVPQLNFSDTMPVDVTILAVTIARDVDKSLTCHISPFERVSGCAIPVSWKICGTYVNSYLGRRAAEVAGFNDAIMLDREGRITEAAVANIFFLQKETVITPALTPNIFPGITRSTLLDVANSLGIEVIERDVFPSELENFDGAFLAATMMELKPLATIHPYRYDSSNHPLFRRFLKEFREITHQ